MVRIKHRYLLTQVLYPASFSSAAAAAAVSQVPTAASSPSLTLSLHAPTPDTVHIGTLLRLIRGQLSSLFGDYGVAVAGSSALKVVYWSNATSTFILRCARGAERLVWSALSFVTMLDIAGDTQHRRGRGRGGARGGGSMRSQGAEKLEIIMRVIRVSGTIRKAEEEAIRVARELLGKVRGVEAAIQGGILTGAGTTMGSDAVRNAGKSFDVHMSDDDEDDDAEDDDEEDSDEDNEMKEDKGLPV